MKRSAVWEERFAQIDGLKREFSFMDNDGLIKLDLSKAVIKRGMRNEK